MFEIGLSALVTTPTPAEVMSVPLAAVGMVIVVDAVGSASSVSVTVWLSPVAPSNTIGDAPSSFAAVRSSDDVKVTAPESATVPEKAAAPEVVIATVGLTACWPTGRRLRHFHPESSVLFRTKTPP